ncbi:MAG: Gfo/Idh/MocA family oxidoreductase [Chloroflexi bacterium]|nr:Gfo/Idh/MocA family oxidoreductase [Chloroflexota bacterium]
MHDTGAAYSGRRLRHAIVGVGAGVFEMHRPALAMETVEVVGVSDVNVSAGQARAAELGCPFFADYRRLFAETRPDVVVVMTPHPFHAEIAIAALESGSHVLTEKSMAVHVGQADAMIAAAERANRLLAANLQFRHRPEIIAARRLLTEGRLGEIQRVDVVANWTRGTCYYRLAPWRGTWKGEGGGVLMNQAPHNLDLLAHLCGMPSRLVAWTRTRLQPIETEDTAHAMLEWPNGALGSFHASTAEGDDLNDRITIVGTGGLLSVTLGRLEASAFEQDLRAYIPTTEIPYGGPGIRPLPVEVGSGSGDHTAVYRDLHAAILDGTPLAADGREGRKSLELANAMTYSSRTGAAVDLPLDRAAYAALLDDLARR